MPGNPVYGRSLTPILFCPISGGGGGDVALLRGAIFFVGMSLWGNQRISTLETYSPMTILPTFRQASLVCTHHLVVYEITLQTERLVNKASHKCVSVYLFSRLDL